LKTAVCACLSDIINPGASGALGNQAGRALYRDHPTGGPEASSHVAGKLQTKSME
jgi:hypothetical protein